LQSSSGPFLGFKWECAHLDDDQVVVSSVHEAELSFDGIDEGVGVWERGEDDV